MIKKMKNTFKNFILIAAAFALLMPTCALADTDTPQPPALKSISFDNARINGKFSPTVYDYTITLEDESLTPTLNGYELDGKAEIFVTYEENSTKQHTGIIVTLTYESGTVVYTFKYTNAKVFAKSSNNYLKELDCQYGEVYPEMNREETSYTLYIPSDMTTLKMSAVCDDVSAVCDLPSELELNAGQELDLSATVISSNGSIRQYTFEIKRLDKTVKEVKKAMSQPDFETLVTDELFYQKPEFFIAIISVLGAVVLFAVFFSFAKRLTVKASDEDERDFFD